MVPFVYVHHGDHPCGAQLFDPDPQRAVPTRLRSHHPPWSLVGPNGREEPARPPGAYRATPGGGQPARSTEDRMAEDRCPLGNIELAATTFYVSDLEAAVAWYGDVL